MSKVYFTRPEVRNFINTVGIDLLDEAFTFEALQMGMSIELEHGKAAGMLNITNDDPLLTGAIALVHLREYPDYYERLGQMEKNAFNYWRDRKTGDIKKKYKDLNSRGLIKLKALKE